MRLVFDKSALKLTEGKGENKKIVHQTVWDCSIEGDFKTDEEREIAGLFQYPSVVTFYGLRNSHEPSVQKKAHELTSRAETLLKEAGEMVRPLSPEEAARTFLALTSELGARLGDADSAKLFELCDAWHWLHMEVYGEHLKAVDATTVRINGAKAVEAKAKMIRTIVMEEVKAVDAREPRKLTAAEMNRKIKDRVHQLCAGQGIAAEHRPKGRTLDKLIREARKRLHTP
jgi:hypothetical protein